MTTVFAIHIRLGMLQERVIRPLYFADTERYWHCTQDNPEMLKKLQAKLFVDL
jgi:hypothetical protein